MFYFANSSNDYFSEKECRYYIYFKNNFLSIVKVENKLTSPKKVYCTCNHWDYNFQQHLAYTNDPIPIDQDIIRCQPDCILQLFLFQYYIMGKR